MAGPWADARRTALDIVEWIPPTLQPVTVHAMPRKATQGHATLRLLLSWQLIGHWPGGKVFHEPCRHSVKISRFLLTFDF